MPLAETLRREAAPAPAVRPVRVVHFITDLEIGGAELMLERYLMHSDAESVDSHVVSLTSLGPIGERMRDHGFPVTVLGLTSVWNFASAAGRLRRVLRELNPDILQTWLYHADCLGAWVGPSAGVSRVFWNLRRSGPQPTDSPSVRTLARINRYLANRVSRILVNSHTGAEQHASIGYPREKMLVVPNGIDAAHWREQYLARREKYRHAMGFTEAEFVIGNLARWTPVKGHPVLLQAAERLMRRNPQARLVLAGRGLTHQNEALMKALRRAGIEDNTRLLGALEDPMDLYALCDIYASASHGEGFPNVLAEAMACGIPCVATDAGDSAELLGPTGRVVTPGQGEALSSAMEVFLRMPEDRRQALGAMAARRMASRYDLRRISGQLDEIYRSELNE